MQELDIRSLLLSWLQHIRAIIVCILAAALLFGGYAFLFIAPTYRSSFQIYVSNYTDIAALQQQQQSINASTGSLAASQLLVQEYITVAENELVVSSVRDELERRGYVMTNRALQRAISMDEEGETAMMNISVVTSDPALSKAICDSFAAVVPDKLKEIVEQGSAKVMAPAKTGVKVGPNVVKSAILGAMLGAVLICGILTVLFLLDNTVSTEKELKRRLDVTVLGEVPSMKVVRKGAK